MISYLTRGQRKHRTNGIVIINFALCNSPNDGRACCECVRETSSSFNLKVEQRPIRMDGGTVLQWYHCIAIDFPGTFSAYARTACAPKTQKWYSLRFLCLSYAPIRSLIVFITTGRFPSCFFCHTHLELSHSLLVSYELCSGPPVLIARRMLNRIHLIESIDFFLLTRKKSLAIRKSHVVFWNGIGQFLHEADEWAEQVKTRRWLAFFFFFHFFLSSHCG